VKRLGDREQNSGEGQTMGVMSNEEALLKELDSDIADAYSSGTLNNKVDIALSFATVVTSLIATALVAANDVVPKVVTALAAALPATCSALQNFVQFKERSSWYFEYAARARAIGMLYRAEETPDLKEFANQRAALEVDMERQWAAIIRGAARPSQPRVTMPEQRK
jgi:hypothetical protein